MHQLQKFTTEYIAAEDRIRLSGQIEGNASLVIWLTQRLLQRLIPVLTEWLENQGPQDLPGEIVHSFAQQAARTKITPQEPVAATAAESSWLASAIDIKRGTQAVRLTFRGTTNQNAELPLNSTHLRQWLAILHDLYAGAQWPMHVWPDWTRPSEDMNHTRMVH